MMGYEMKLVRNCSRVEPQKVGLALVVMCFFFTVTFLSVSKPFVLPLPIFGSRLTSRFPIFLIAEGTNSSQHLGREKKIGLRFEKNSSTSFAASIQEQDGNNYTLLGAGNQKVEAAEKPLCDFSDPRSDVCEMKGDIRIHGNSSSILFINPYQSAASQSVQSWLIKPHPRKGDSIALDHVTEMSVKSSTNNDEAPHCTITHTVPAIVFSTGGYMGNIFHDFTDVLIPLFITSAQYQGEVQFLVSETHSWWLSKYRPLLKELSHYEIIDFNRDTEVHCYPHAIIGLRSHKEMSIDPSRTPNGHSMVDFAELVRQSYSLERESAIKLKTDQLKKPRLLIIARKWTRSFKNVDEIVRMAEGLGYEVVVVEANVGSNLARFARIVNSCDVMMGVHGAGLTNLVFLPVNATVIQVVPLGGLEKIAWGDFGGPSLDMKLKYLQYRISEEESSLIDLYSRDHAVFTDPSSIHKQGWLALRDIYLDKQSVRLDVQRFKGYLVQALEFLNQ